MATTTINLQANNHRLTRFVSTDLLTSVNSTWKYVLDRSSAVTGEGPNRPNGLTPSHISIQRIWYSCIPTEMAIGSASGAMLVGSLPDNSDVQLIVAFHESGFMDFSNAGGLVFARNPSNTSGGDLALRGTSSSVARVSVCVEMVFHD
jgi:hypothetical protein